MKCMVKNTNPSEKFYNDELQKAKTYYMPTNAMLKECKNEGDYWDEYVRELKDANNIEELASVLNKYTDIIGDGSHFLMLNTFGYKHKCTHV